MYSALIDGYCKEGSSIGPLTSGAFMKSWLFTCQVPKGFVAHKSCWRRSDEPFRSSPFYVQRSWWTRECLSYQEYLLFYIPYVITPRWLYMFFLIPASQWRPVASEDSLCSCAADHDPWIQTAEAQHHEALEMSCREALSAATDGGAGLFAGGRKFWRNRGTPLIDDIWIFIPSRSNVAWQFKTCFCISWL